MQLSKTSKILLITLLAIILIGGIFLVVKKQTNDIEKPITEVEGQAENQDQAIEPDTQDQVETDNQTDQDNANEEQTNNQTIPSDQPTINSEPETIIPDQPINQEVTNLDTSNWKTYTNQEYGFSFKYPTERIEPDREYSVWSRDNKWGVNSGGEPIFYVSAHPQSEKEDFLAFYQPNCKYLDEKLLFVKNNLEVSRVECAAGGADIIIDRDEFFITFYGIIGDQPYKKYSWALLSSFRFF